MALTDCNTVPLIEALCAELRELYVRVEALAAEAAVRLAAEEPADECLAALEGLTTEANGLQQLLARAVESQAAAGLSPAAREALAQTRWALAQGIGRVNTASAEAARSLVRVGQQIDEGVQGQKGCRAYLSNSR